MNIKSALGKVHPWVPSIGVRSVSADANIWHLARWDYAGVMSNALQNARLVVWFPFESTRLLSPGVYCPDLKTAAYVTMVIGSIRICPKCENTFIPKTDNQDYCEPKHGIAHRTALSRWRKKQRVEAKRSFSSLSTSVSRLSGRRAMMPEVYRIRLVFRHTV